VNGRSGTEQVWLNPPRHDDPYEDIIIQLHPAAAAAAADALEAAAERAGSAGDRETAYLLRHVADDIEAASVTPAAADGTLSREATWHPANIMARLTPAAIRNAARYQGPSYVASTAIQAAAAIAWSAGGRIAKGELLEQCHHEIQAAASESYPAGQTPGEPWHDPAPVPSAARVARRRKLGLPPVAAPDSETAQ
jgi:hypothetical protein